MNTGPVFANQECILSYLFPGNTETEAKHIQWTISPRNTVLVFKNHWAYLEGALFGAAELLEPLRLLC